MSVTCITIAVPVSRRPMTICECARLLGLCLCLDHVEEARRFGFLMGGSSSRFVPYRPWIGRSLLFQQDISGYDVLFCSYECAFL